MTAPPGATLRLVPVYCRTMRSNPFTARRRGRAAPIRTLAAAAAALSLGAAPAAAKQTSCERQPGKTLAASSSARLFQVGAKTSARRAGVYLCSYRTSKSRLLFSGRDLPDAYGLGGAYAFALYREEPSETGPDEGVLRTTIYVSGPGRSKVRLAGTSGSDVSDVVISDDGVVAALANSRGPQAYSLEGPPATVQPTSAILVFDARHVARDGTGRWVPIATAAPGTFTRLAATPDRKTLLWSKLDGSVGTAPLAAPVK